LRQSSQNFDLDSRVNVNTDQETATVLKSMYKPTMHCRNLWSIFEPYHINFVFFFSFFPFSSAPQILYTFE